MANYDIMVLACQVGLFYLTLTQIKSEMNCIAKNKCPERQKLDTRRRGENVTLVESNNMYIFAFFVFDLFYVIDKSVRKSYVHSETVLFCRMFCVIIGTRPIGDSITPRLDKDQ